MRFYSDCGARKGKCKGLQNARDISVTIPQVEAPRVFTLGIGNAVSHKLVTGMAHAGRGTAGTCVAH